MRCRLSATILALLPLVSCGPFGSMPSTPNSNSLAVRAAEPANIVTLAASQDQPYFQITSFDAFIASTAAIAAASLNPAAQYSRAMFDLRLMHPDETKRWTTRCFVHTADKLCNPDVWRDCMQVAGEANRGEKLRFRFGDDLSSVEISRSWTYNGVTLRVGADEPATWVLKTSANDKNGNMTVTPMGNWYKKPEAWVLPWKQAVA